MVLNSVLPKSTTTFLETLAANTHIDWGDTPYVNHQVVIDCCKFLGCKTIRGAVPSDDTLPKYIDIAKAGIKILFASDTHRRADGSYDIYIDDDLKRVGRLLDAVPGCVAGFEGANEYNSNRYWEGGELSEGNPEWAKRVNKKIYDAIHADPKFKGVPYIAMTMSNSTDDDVRRMGDMSPYVDRGSWHTYFGNGEQPLRNVASGYKNAKRGASQRGMWYTEIGHSTVQPWVSNWGTGGDWETSPRLILNTWADIFLVGADKAFFYMLLNNVYGKPDNNLEQCFGLFWGDGSPKPSATAIHNLSSILAGAGATSLAPFVYSLDNLDKTNVDGQIFDTHFVLQNANGDNFVVVWSEPQIWNNNQRIAVQPKQVTLNVGTATTITTFDPLISDKAILIAANAKSMTFGVSDHVVVFKVGKAAGAVVTPPVTPPVVPPVKPPTGTATISGPAKLTAEVRVPAISVTDPTAATGTNWIAVDVTGAKVAYAGTLTAPVPGFFLEGTLAELNKVLATLQLTSKTGTVSIQVKFGTAAVEKVLRVFTIGWPV